MGDGSNKSVPQIYDQFINNPDQPCWHNNIKNPNFNAHLAPHTAMVELYSMTNILTQKWFIPEPINSRFLEQESYLTTTHYPSEEKEGSKPTRALILHMIAFDHPF